MERMPGIIYQECPMPANSGSNNNNNYNFYGFYDSTQYPSPAVVLPNSGHLRVTVSPERVKVDYVRAYLSGYGHNGEVAYSYTVLASEYPNAPSLIQPSNSATNTSTAPVLKITATDPNNNDLDVTFYGRAVGGSFKEIGTVKGVSSGTTASIAWLGLVSSQKYEWYAKAYNGNKPASSSIWSFTIPSMPHRLTMAVNAAGKGAANPSIGSHSYEENSVVAITAVPAVGYASIVGTGMWIIPIPYRLPSL
jgi:hypothetical protein